MSADDEFATFLATRDPQRLEYERFAMPTWGERTGSTEDQLMRGRHRAHSDAYWAAMRHEITPAQFRELVSESREYEPVKPYKPRRGIPSRRTQEQIAARAAETRAA